MATPPKPPIKNAATPPPQAQTAPQPRAAVPPQQTGPGIPPKPTPDPTPQTMTLNIHGVLQGPKTDMAPEVDTSELNPGTIAEMEAGKKALKEYTGRTQAEMEYGRSMVARKSGQPVEASPSKSD
jgi:hypothetical protein